MSGLSFGAINKSFSKFSSWSSDDVWLLSSEFSVIELEESILSLKKLLSENNWSSSMS